MLASQEGPILKRLQIGHVPLTACQGFFFFHDDAFWAENVPSVG